MAGHAVPGRLLEQAAPVLYTAGDTHPFDATAHQSGLLIDEWTEVIPATTKDTGLTSSSTGLTTSHRRPSSW